MNNSQNEFIKKNSCQTNCFLWKAVCAWALMPFQLCQNSFLEPAEETWPSCVCSGERRGQTRGAAGGSQHLRGHILPARLHWLCPVSGANLKDFSDIIPLFIIKYC